MRIPIELKPYLDEILSSWLIRNSLANGSDPSSWVGSIWLEFRAWSRDIDRHLPKDKINKLSKITSLNKEQIKSLTLEPLVEKMTNEVSLNPKKAWYFVVPTGLRGTTKINGTHFCPKCLSEPKPYIKKQWRLAWNIACPIHKKLLISKCQKCNTTYAPHLVDYLNTKIYVCTGCGYDLRQSEIADANNDVLLLQKNLNNAIFNNKINDSFPLVEQSIPELFITLRILLSFFRTLHRLHLHKDIFEKIDIPLRLNISTFLKGKSFEALNVKDREILLLMVSKLFKFNTDEIKNIFEDSKLQYKMIVNQLSVKSKTIEYISKDLAISDTSSISVDMHKEIKPRSKEDVEKLMDEIRPFI